MLKSVLAIINALKVFILLDVKHNVYYKSETFITSSSAVSCVDSMYDCISWSAFESEATIRSSNWLESS